MITRRLDAPTFFEKKQLKRSLAMGSYNAQTRKNRCRLTVRSMDVSASLSAAQKSNQVESQQ